jgi:hypothetical protein
MVSFKTLDGELWSNILVSIEFPMLSAWRRTPPSEEYPDPMSHVMSYVMSGVRCQIL